MKTILRLILLISLGVVVVQQAHAVPPSRLAVVDIQLVLERSKTGQQSKKALDAERTDRQKKVASLEAEFKKTRDSVKQQLALLSNDAKEKKLDELRVKERELQGVFSSEQDELRRKSESSVKKIVTQVRQIAQRLAEERGVQFVLEAGDQSIVYVADELDITSDVIAALDKAA